MDILFTMSLAERVQVLSDSAQFDLCDYSADPSQRNPSVPGIYYTSYRGCRVPLFKVLLTNRCCNDCRYCINSAEKEPVELKPEEIAGIFLDYYERRYVDGLFLSSGVSRDPDETMEKLLETLRILRLEGYGGYIHLKIIPGSSMDTVRRAMELASRVSINLETATRDGLDELSSTKDYTVDILRRMRWISRFKKRYPELATSGQSTQLMVGAVDETDEDIVKRVKWIYDKYSLRRVYFSGFQPIEGTELEKRAEADPRRVFRLYQTDSLLKSYGFGVDELRFSGGYLDTSVDPKYAAAMEMDIFPVDLKTAPYHEIIRVPGIGPRSARKIIELRERVNLTADILKGMGVRLGRAEPFIYLDGSQTTLSSWNKGD